MKLCTKLTVQNRTVKVVTELKLDVVQLCETQKVRLFHVLVGLMGLCG